MILRFLLKSWAYVVGLSPIAIVTATIIHFDVGTHIHVTLIVYSSAFQILLPFLC